MLQIQRIVILMMLAIASMGQIPYLLHHYHCHSGREDCSGLALSGTENTNHVHAHQHATQGCAHSNHRHVHRIDHRNRSIAVDKRPVPNRPTNDHSVYLDGHLDHPHSCSVCFYLSQSMAVAAAFDRTESESVIDRFITSTESKSLQASFGISSPRAPPAV